MFDLCNLNLWSLYLQVMYAQQETTAMWAQVHPPNAILEPTWTILVPRFVMTAQRGTTASITTEQTSALKDITAPHRQVMIFRCVPSEPLVLQQAWRNRQNAQTVHVRLCFYYYKGLYVWKPNFVLSKQKKVQISLLILAVWSAPLLFTL